MSRKAEVLSITEFLKAYGDEKSAKKLIKDTLFENGKVKCPLCQRRPKKQSTDSANRYWCGECRKKFSLKQCTQFKYSRLPFNKLLTMMYFLMCDRDGTSSLAMSKRVGISQKSAWLNAHKIRNAMAPKIKPILDGKVVIDEGHVKGRNRWVMGMAQVKPMDERVITKAGRKQIVRERGRKVLIPMSGCPSESKSRTTKHAYIKPGSTIITDCATYHLPDLPEFNQVRENHADKAKGEYFQTSPVDALFAKLRYSYSIYRF